MKIKFFIFFLMLIFLNCKNGNNSKMSEEFEIEQITTDLEVVGDFDRDKYPILQNGILLKIEGKFEEAITEFNKAEKIYGKMIPIYLNRGVSYYNLGGYSKAEIDFSICLEIDSTYLPALLNRGILYVHNNELEKGLADLNKAIQLDSLEPSVFLNRAVAYRELNRMDLACIDLNKAKSLGIKEKYNSNMTEKMFDELKCENII
jgi:tetratricopeptide (TPR) repeat protein